jgi:hypothetical protein
MALAADKKIQLGKTPLFWADPEAKTCNICDAADHLAAECEAERGRPKYINKRQKLKEFRSNSKIRKGNRYSSYADATKSGHLNLHKDFTRTFVLGIKSHVSKILRKIGMKKKIQGNDQWPIYLCMRVVCIINSLLFNNN